jgi:hypothetical protein
MMENSLAGGYPESPSKAFSARVQPVMAGLRMEFNEIR